MRHFLQGLMVALAVVGGALGLMQCVPYGRAHVNPPMMAEPAWDAPRTRELAVRACFDCHSNETKWPWYTHVAPMSWMVERDVSAGREILNFSEWNRPHALAGYSGRRTMERMMPPASYIAAHPEADLTDAERAELARGLDATLGPHERELSSSSP